ncbi:unnamed protein product [Blepharisma stoltei]|uniref:Uncharacterized protein n=1 Tax=Blepharisma stoltei TaxID=1481888 RepID=A0AAU9INE5_9CILI|nr:unnamed protein product [Blepharisma stoltei]
MSLLLKQISKHKKSYTQLATDLDKLRIRRFLKFWIHFYEDCKRNLLHLPKIFPNIINNMSLFGFTLDECSADIDNWMSEIKENLDNITNKQATDYEFDFANELPQIKTQRFQWEEIQEGIKPSCGFYSSFRNSYARSSISTMPSLDADQVEEIPKILDLNMRVSLDSENFGDFSLKNQKSL